MLNSAIGSSVGPQMTGGDQHTTDTATSNTGASSETPSSDPSELCQSKVAEDLAASVATIVAPAATAADNTARNPATEPEPSHPLTQQPVPGSISVGQEPLVQLDPRVWRQRAIVHHDGPPMFFVIPEFERSAVRDMFHADFEELEYGGKVYGDGYEFVGNAVYDDHEYRTGGMTVFASFVKEPIVDILAHINSCF